VHTQGKRIGFLDLRRHATDAAVDGHAARARRRDTLLVGARRGHRGFQHFRTGIRRHPAMRARTQHQRPRIPRGAQQHCIARRRRRRGGRDGDMDDGHEGEL
jgi:hypothetical protein